jgi:hypothetical protein
VSPDTLAVAHPHGIEIRSAAVGNIHEVACLGGTHCSTASHGDWILPSHVPSLSADAIEIVLVVVAEELSACEIDAARADAHWARG